MLKCQHRYSPQQAAKPNSLVRVCEGLLVFKNEQTPCRGGTLLHLTGPQGKYGVFYGSALKGKLPYIYKNTAASYDAMPNVDWLSSATCSYFEVLRGIPTRMRKFCMLGSLWVANIDSLDWGAQPFLDCS